MICLLAPNALIVVPDTMPRNVTMRQLRLELLKKPDAR